MILKTLYFQLERILLYILFTTALSYRVDSEELSPLAATSGYDLALANKNCDGFPQVSISSLQNTCVGLLAAKPHHIIQPRYAAQLDEKTLLVTDMEGWDINNGTVWAIEFANKFNEQAQGQTQSIKVTSLFSHHDLPNPAGIAVGPNGLVYVGLPTGIMRFAIQRNAKGEIQTDPKLEVFINDFDQSRKFLQNATSMKQYAHPLTAFSFSPDYRFIYVNLGSKTDSCAKNKSFSKSGMEMCEESSGEFPLGSVRRYALDSQFNVVSHSGISFANGLRNSMALAVHSSGLVLQGENARDLPDSELPSDEINVLQLSKDNKAQHYGWPYCYNDGNKIVNSAEFGTRKKDCESAFIPATVPLPAHSAPLGMLYPSPKKLPMLENTLLISLHGYAAHGHRLVALPVNEAGMPNTKAPLMEVIYNWGSAYKLNPLGAPTGLLEWSDGSIIIMDDKNSAILRLSRGEPVKKTDLIAHAAIPFKITDAMGQRFAPLNTILKSKCGACHNDMAGGKPGTNLQALINSGKLNPSGLEESSLLTKIRYWQMPPKTSDPKVFPKLTATEHKLLLHDIVGVFEK